jgi:23S rRNA (uracil1939-C5)-methyltransferase/tRNA (uracil-5-)-methyltransferase
MENASEVASRGAPEKFNPVPFAYHSEVEVEISTLTNLGDGLGRVGSWVVMVPFALPGECVRARVWHNAANFSRADLIRVLRPAPGRVEPRCPLFGACGGCQFQNFSYASQLEWKGRIVGDLLKRIGGLGGVVVNPCVGSPREFFYRSKITPHFQAPRGGGGAFPIGFLAANQRRKIVDVPQCPIATEAINAALPGVRARSLADRARHRRGATLLLRDAGGEVVTDPRRTIGECVGIAPAPLRMEFLAGDFFQNNPSILPAFVNHVVGQARGDDCRFLVDAYCGSGLFALAAASCFEQTLGVEVNADAVRKAEQNARLNKLANCRFEAGSAEGIFASAPPFPDATAVILDPPRRGCDGEFLRQLVAYGPRRVVYVSCSPDTQARDLRELLAAGYAMASVQPFDLFPQTRHVENVVTLTRAVAG